MLRHAAFPDGVTRDDLLAWYRALRERTRRLFDLITPGAYYERPISLRNPIVFYEGHLPAFSVNTLARLAHKRPGIDERLEVLFARGIDPESEDAVKSPTDVWPSRAEVQAYGAEADRLIEDLLRNAPLEDDGVPELRGGEAVFTILEHEAMHQETLLYMLHNLPPEKKIWSAAAKPPLSNLSKRRQAAALQSVPAGMATLGAERDAHFGWDNEFPSLRVDVAAFDIDADNVTNGEYLEFIEATGAPAPHFWIRQDREWRWRGMFGDEPMPLDAAVYVTHDEANAYARWKGRRLPTEGEYHRAAFGTPSGEERQHPWGDELPFASNANIDFASWEPVTVGSFDNESAWGVRDLVGNGWEWTSTVFDGFPGFAAMPSYAVYSADFFDGMHYVLKGGSPATDRRLVRRSFRNWFRPAYPYVYATFRTVQSR